ncbi:CHASE2 domain-containing protein [Spirochaeta dissipatitropha]
MAVKGIHQKIFSTRYFAFIIAALVMLLVILLQVFSFTESMERVIIDVRFRLREVYSRERTLQEGVSFQQRNYDVHPDILIVGIDTNALNRLGSWPFPRRIHGNLVNNFARIQDQNARERALFLDIFFNEPAQNPTDDAMLVHSMRQNDRVFLESILTDAMPREQDREIAFARQRQLIDRQGIIRNIEGDHLEMPPFLGVDAPLMPYGASVKGFGHANFIADPDSIFRRQPLIARSVELIATYTLEELEAGLTRPIDISNFERLAWHDRAGNQHTVEYPLTDQFLAELKIDLDRYAPQHVDADGNNTYLIRHYKDHFIPSITLSLALEYFNLSVEDIEVELGKQITLHNPQVFNTSSAAWEPYNALIRPPVYSRNGVLTREAEYEILESIQIPINHHGEMMVNFAGGRSVPGRETFPVRSYAGYASRVTSPDPYTWPRTMAVENKIIMVGAFASGMADDEKNTPLGLMYGVEMHANALNTILMNRFIHYAPFWLNLTALAFFILLTAFISSRLPTLWALLYTVLVIFGLFIATTFIFNQNHYIIDFAAPAIGIFLTFISIVVYRVMTEEKDKRRIRDMFGRYVSPQVVNQILENPPELGGVDKEITVMFSDIRGFTTLSESMTPQELVNHLNLYLTAMTDIILEFKGTLDKYVGDEIMCFWGAPLPQEDHAIQACRCAVKQMHALNELNEGWPVEKRISIGIGINSGVMTVGNMGSLGRMNYTLMGDNVNLGARLEGTNKQYKTEIIISEYTYGLVKDKVVARELDNIRVKGKNRPVLIYELVDVLD